MLKPIPLHPKVWRESKGYSLERMAVLLDVKSGRSLYWRWETGEYCPPFEIIDEIEKMSGGTVTFASWLAVRRAWVAAHPKVTTEKVAA